MNYKLLLGRCFAKLDSTIRKSKIGLINKIYPWNRDFVFDLKRIFGNSVETIVDAGANVGSVSKEFAYYFPNANILAFEPVANTYSKLKRRLLANKNVIPINLALGEDNYQVKIALNVEDTINSIASTPQAHNICGYETIHVESLESYCKTNDIKNIDILKIDVEGYEFKVLEGSKKFIHNTIKAIVLEVGYERNDDKVHFSEVENFMEQHGFQCCGIYDLSRSSDKKRLYYSNNLYIRKSLL